MYDRWVVSSAQARDELLEAAITFGVLELQLGGGGYMDPNPWDYTPDPSDPLWDQGVEEGRGLRDDFTGEDLYVWAGEVDAAGHDLLVRIVQAILARA